MKDTEVIEKILCALEDLADSIRQLVRVAESVIEAEGENEEDG